MTNARRDRHLPGSEEERSAQSFVPLGANRWARRVVGPDGRPVVYADSQLLEEILLETRAVRLGIEHYLSASVGGNYDLLAEARDV